MAAGLLKLLINACAALAAIFNFNTLRHNDDELHRQKKLCADLEATLNAELDKPAANADFVRRLRRDIKRQQKLLKCLSARIPDPEEGTED